jgi:hypothetical protein
MVEGDDKRKKGGLPTDPLAAELRRDHVGYMAYYYIKTWGYDPLVTFGTEIS